MTIAELFRGLRIKRSRGSLEKKVEGITYDSRRVKNGYLFVAIKGFSSDGHTYIRDAINRGGVGVVAERAFEAQNETAVIEVEDSREALAFLSAAFYGHPSLKISLIGITGTNGKTSTGYLVKNVLDTWGKKAGLLGTIHYIVDNRVIPPSHTTPESTDLQRHLRNMVDSGTDYAVVEVSSHALALQRVAGCSFRVAAFTNFSRDHLDFHGTMDEYFRAKSSIFDYLGKDGLAVLNWDDPKIRGLAEKLNCDVITCGLEDGAHIRAVNVREKGVAGGISFDIRTPGETFTLSSGLVGQMNVYNILMSAGIAYGIGVDTNTIVKGIGEARPVAGRFERVDEGQEFLCIVDYAHTEDALRKLIGGARKFTKGKVITVFGCGGDRDSGKRPAMGAAATELSDLVIVTSDNPRTEDPMRIIGDITARAVKKSCHVEPDRKKAIEYAVSAAAKGDTVLIAGKGHEDYQEIKGMRHPFSDKDVLREIIRNKNKNKK
jgi:UDP-N-acetylmuramoyl-L-alanyl-D-glutamate--2,6-diaminopimelate ligase